MDLLYDFLPILVFFAAYKFYGIYPATAAAIITVALQVGFILLKGKKPKVAQIITLCMMVVLGGATLFFHNEMFIKWKPTAVYGVLGSALLISDFWGNKNLIQKMLEANLTLPPHAWRILNLSWITFFYVMGIINLVVVYTFDTNTWVNFKLFGTLALVLVFAIIQALLVARWMPPSSAEKK